MDGELSLDPDFDVSSSTGPYCLHTVYNQSLLHGGAVCVPSESHRRVGFRWRVDDDLPTVVGDERVLEVRMHCTAQHVRTQQQFLKKIRNKFGPRET